MYCRKHIRQCDTAKTDSELRRNWTEFKCVRLDSRQKPQKIRQENRSLHVKHTRQYATAYLVRSCWVSGKKWEFCRKQQQKKSCKNHNATNKGLKYYRDECRFKKLAGEG